LRFWEGLKSSASSHAPFNNAIAFATDGARSRPTSSPWSSLTSTFAGQMGGVRFRGQEGIRGEHGIRLNSGLGVASICRLPNAQANVSGWAGGHGRHPTGIGQ
jgi:hypothetical protein